MRVLAINGSPNMDKGNTAMILNPFLDGMKEAGADVQLFYTRKLKIEPCYGEMSCWFQNPGKCIHDDDMQMLLPKFKEADAIVWASPVYYAGITGTLKNLMDRQVPLFMQENPRTKLQKIVLVSTCGAWELSMFDPLLSQMTTLYSRPEENSEFVGALLRPMADGMREMIKAGETRLVTEIVQAAREAGSQLVRKGKITDEIQEKVSKVLVPRDAYYKAFQEAIDQARKSRSQ